MKHRLSLCITVISMIGFILSIIIGVQSRKRRYIVQSYTLGNCISGRGTGDYGNFNDNCYIIEVTEGAVSMGYRNQRFTMTPAIYATLARQQGVSFIWRDRRSDVYGLVNIPKAQGLRFKYGLTVYRGVGNILQFGRRLIIPFWFIVTMFSLLPVRMIWRRIGRTRRRRAAGLCVKCEYNLTSNTSGVCPECGTAMAKEPGATTINS